MRFVLDYLSQKGLEGCELFLKISFCDIPFSPLDWWAVAGYRLVMRGLGCTEAEARRRVRLKIRDYYERTGDPIWKPVGSAGYAALRQAIMDGRVLLNDLM